MEKRDSFIFYRSFHEALKQLPDDVRLQLYDAIAEYALSGGESKPMLSGVALSLWILIEPQLRANIQRYNNGKKGGDYGKLGGAPKGNKNATRAKKQLQNNPKTTPNVNDNVNVNDNENDMIFIIPKGYERFKFDFVEDAFREPFFKWLDYKRAKGQKYKAQNSLESAYKSLKSKSNNDPFIAQQIIEQSLANNWAGLFELKDTRYETTNNSNYQRAIQIGADAIVDLLSEIE